METVNHPLHYQSVSQIGLPILEALGIPEATLKMECIEAIESLEATRRWNFNILNAVKYLWRCGMKGDAIKDLRKARWYLARHLESKFVCHSLSPTVGTRRAINRAIPLIESTIAKLEGKP